MGWTYVGLSCIVHPSFFAFKFRRDYMVRPYRYNKHRTLPEEGTMQLYILRGMKVEVIVAFVVICTHEEYVEHVIYMLTLQNEHVCAN
jgi:hypothetical protein